MQQRHGEKMAMRGLAGRRTHCVRNAWQDADAVRSSELLTTLRMGDEAIMDDHRA